MHNEASAEVAFPQTVTLGELGESLGFLLRVAQITAFEQFYAALGFMELQPGEFSVLWMISKHGEVRQGELAGKLRIKPAHMTKTIQRIESKGLLVRRIPKSDRRSVLLSLTPEGAAFVAGHEERFLDSGHYLRSDLDEKEIRQLVHLLQKFSRVLP